MGSRRNKVCGRIRICVIAVASFGYILAYMLLEGNSTAILSDDTMFSPNIRNSVENMDFSQELNRFDTQQQISEHSARNRTAGITIQKAYLFDIQDEAASISRVYQPSPPSKWCVDARLKLDQSPNEPMGLCYIRIPHSAGSTLKGINMRISRTIAQRYGKEEGIERCIRHDSNAPGLRYSRRHKMSYLWTFLRDPVHRGLSVVGSTLSHQLLHQNSRDSFNSTTETVDAEDGKKLNTTRANNDILVNRTLDMLQNSIDINNGILSEGRGGFQLQFCMQTYVEANSIIHPSNRTRIVDHVRLRDFVSKTFERFDFVGIVERFDESLVAMKLLMGLKTSDILYFAANRKEEWQRVRVRKRGIVCRKPFDWEVDLMTEPPILQHVTQSKEWLTQNYGDYLFYYTANQSLDRTIRKIGLEVFSKELKEFRALLQRASEECNPKFPCSRDGKDQWDESRDDCLDGYACGYRCFDEVTK